MELAQLNGYLNAGAFLWKESNNSWKLPDTLEMPPGLIRPLRRQSGKGNLGIRQDVIENVPGV